MTLHSEEPPTPGPKPYSSPRADPPPLDPSPFQPPQEPVSPSAPPVLASQAGAREPIGIDPAITTVWRFEKLLGSLVITGLLAIPATITAINAPAARTWIALAISIWILMRLFWISWYPPKRRRSFFYRLDDHVLEIGFGVWWKTVQWLPLTRLQHVDIQRGPIERRFDLASLILYTAGTHAAVLVIPGLKHETAIAMRNHLVMQENTRSDGV